MTILDETVNKQPAWRKTATQGLYQNKSGIFYSRYRLNGKRTWRSLGTEVFTVAKLRHAERQRQVEGDRQRGATLDTDGRTLGALATEYLRRLGECRMTDRTKANCGGSIKRLRARWPGHFDTATARGVDLDAIFALRRELTAAEWLPPRSKKLKTGYSGSIVNRTLGMLRQLLDIAVEAHAIPANPFASTGTLQDKIFLHFKSRVPVLPSRADMERIFAELLVCPAIDSYPERAERWRKNARDSAEHARLLAYSGMRWNEANAAEMTDDRGDTMAVRGTKTKAAVRIIPVTPPLRQLLDGIRARGVTGKILAVQTSLNPLKRACRRLGLPALRHHDLRHYFATVCIESGVDIPTVAGWLGHADGGALLMKTYSHLRQEHSIAAARRVNFGTAPQSTAA